MTDDDFWIEQISNPKPIKVLEAQDYSSMSEMEYFKRKMRDALKVPKWYMYSGWIKKVSKPGYELTASDEIVAKHCLGYDD